MFWGLGLLGASGLLGFSASMVFSPFCLGGGGGGGEEGGVGGGWALGCLGVLGFRACRA